MKDKKTYAKALLGKELYEVKMKVIPSHPGCSQERHHSYQFVQVASKVGTLRQLHVKEIGCVQLHQRDGDHKLSHYRPLQKLHHGKNG